MLKATFKNLGPIKNAEIELNDLTIIAGKNNSGKTYISYAIYGFLNNLSDHNHVDNTLIHPYTQDITQQLSTQGVATISITNEELKALKEGLIEELSSKYSVNLHNFFSSTERYFKNTNVAFNINGDQTEFEAEVKFSKKGSSKFNSIKVKRQGDKFIFNLNTIENIPDYIMDSIVSDAFVGLLFAKKTAFIISAERFGISLFYKDLDVAKNRVVEMLQKMEGEKGRKFTPFDVLNRFSSRYAVAIQDNIDYVRDLSIHSKETSEINTDKLFGYIKDMMNAYYRVDEDEIRLMGISKN